MGEHTKTGVLQPLTNPAEESQVLKRATRQYDPLGLRRFDARTSRSESHTLVKGGGNLRAGPTRLEIVVGSGNELGTADHPGVDRAFIRLGSYNTRELLQLDRRLSLIGHLVAQAEQGGDCVKQPPHTRGQRSVDLKARPNPAQSLNGTGRPAASR